MWGWRSSKEAQIVNREESDLGLWGFGLLLMSPGKPGPCLEITL